MQKRRYVKLLGLLFMYGTALMIGLAVFLPQLIDLNQYRDEIISSLQKNLNRKVSFSNGKFKMQIGPTFVFDNVVVRELDETGDLIKARQVTIHLAVLPLLKKKVVLRDLLLDGAEVRLNRDAQGKLNVDDLLKPSGESYQIHLSRFKTSNSTFFWQDQAVDKQGLNAEIRNINMTLSKISRGHKGSFKISAEIPAMSGAACQVSLSGTAKIPDEGKSLMETDLNTSCDIKQADPGRFWPYFGKYVPFGNTGGRVDLSGSFKGQPREFSFKGKLRLANVAIVWPTVFHHPVNPRLADLDFELKLNKNSIEMPKINFSADGFKVKGSCNLLDITSQDIHIKAKATTEPFILENLRQWIPYGIIAKDASQYIEEHVVGGVFRLESGVLDGKASQIVSMEKGTNYNVLHIKGVVDKGIVSYGKNAPTFNNIKAGLELVGKDFILSRVTANYGGTPFKGEGRITDYPLDAPCQYPFQLEFTPKPAEVAWLGRFVRADKLEFSGNSHLSLKGSGVIAAYKLSGDWDLKQAAYSFPGAIRKTAGMPNNLTFSAILGGEETRLTSIFYSLAPLSLSATAQFKYGANPYLGFELQTNKFLLGSSLPILTGWQDFQPRGRMQAHIAGSGNPEDFSAMDYSGTIDLNAFSFQPGDELKTVSNINGTVSFKGNSLETSNINVRYGSSMINARGRVRNFKNPEAELLVSSPQFYLKDASLVLPQPDASIRNLNLNLYVKDEVFTLRYLTGQLNSTKFNVSGNYSGGSQPSGTFTVKSPNLDIDDLLLLSEMKGQDIEEEDGPNTNIKLKLNADAGKFGKMLFTNLNADISGEQGVFYLQALNASMYGGTLTAKGRVAPGVSQGHRYGLNFNMNKVSAEPLMAAMDLSRKITGTLSIDGDLTASGANKQEIKRSMLGNIRLRLDNGKLYQLSTLSKLFSILNVSQLLKFQLPDMVSDGMPYKRIKGSIAVNDGVMSTQDLFINSDALNISIIGSSDIVKENLNLTIGVQPLQTVDKIVNRIPVVGWLLTGKGNAFLTAYFEATGSWSDPKVTAIPVKLLGQGVFNIFRRVFELPVSLFTDTGEVILGK